jgi:hypothetical protein
MKHTVKLTRTLTVTLTIDEGLTPEQASEFALEIADEEIFVSTEEVEKSGAVVEDTDWSVVSSRIAP